ncbi:Crp/Fnr family transcriptional regulator [Nocardia sp. CDC159]|uniref:Crp/Fnr family transcriptional regulator n=1 Tax=Nocardia pulmonis TaxID=2951408 RepID=A0A9X2E4F5_9NOCA|nr:MULTISPECIES: Crp/Fnr family transcriptional regulator [Nocardia]MCM6773436.1 Crp/Fnr family transcriptional regulator [Nocardia pulmonis]MCM6786323.1 Crp/Fnr family transcriptional regulator [Nocardia sp. CDC159]
MDSAFDGFVAAMRAIAPVPDAQFERARALFRPVRLDERAHFVRAGDRTDRVGFLVEGLLRSYYLTADGVERTKAFVAGRRLVCPYAANLRKQVSDLFIQALTPATLLVAERARFDELVAADPSWRAVIAALTERHYLEEDSAHRRLLLDDPATRYAQFLREHGELAGRISGRVTASYLAITPEALSRIRSRRTSPIGGH